MLYRLSIGVGFLCKLTQNLITQPDFFKILPSISAFVREGKLYWKMEDSGFIVVDPSGGKVYRVFETSDELSDQYLCDNALAILVALSLYNFIDAVNDRQNDFTNLTLHLDQSTGTLCKSVARFLKLGIKAEDLKRIDSFIRNGKLYWSLDDQGFVVIDPKNEKVYRVFEASDKLSDQYLCDNALARLVDLDIHEFVKVLNKRSMVRLAIASMILDVLDDLNDEDD